MAFAFKHSSIPTLVLCMHSFVQNTSWRYLLTFWSPSAKFQAENHSFDRIFHDFPRPQDASFAEYLVKQLSWSFAPFNGGECHVLHNPAYNSCLRTGNFWFDSPIYEEVGCYSTTKLIQLFEKTSPNLEVLDLEFFRQNGYCVRYKEEAYRRMLPMPSNV